jgi:choline dehydrogenase-like flavoprotein
MTGRTPSSVVVVGAGSAGCVVASRLSERSDLRVTLLEAGPATSTADTLAIDSPDFFAATSTGQVWPHLPVLHRSHDAGPVRARHYLRGRGLGGSSLVNAMIALEPDSLPVAVPASTPPHRLPISVAPLDALGAVDLALLAAAPAARPAPLTMAAGRRVSSAEAYLTPVLERSNLIVRTDAAVATVRCTGAAARVTEVVLTSGEDVPADVVVLCAGAIHSPTILLRSGIAVGTAGTGLRDHPSLPYALGLTDVARSPSSAALAAGALAEVGDLQLLALNHLGPPDAPERGLGMLMPAVMRPYGAGGVVRLDPDRVGDPTAPPLIEFDLVGDPRDVARLVAASHWAEHVLGHAAFSAIVDEVYIDADGSTVAAIADDEARRRWVRSAVGDYVHATSTCAIGTVVDPTGAVFDHEGLFVCDASIFPTIPEVNTHLPVTLLAEALCATWLGGQVRSSSSFSDSSR